MEKEASRQRGWRSESPPRLVNERGPGLSMAGAPRLSHLQVRYLVLGHSWDSCGRLWPCPGLKVLRAPGKWDQESRRSRVTQTGTNPGIWEWATTQTWPESCSWWLTPGCSEDVFAFGESPPPSTSVSRLDSGLSTCLSVSLQANMYVHRHCTRV